MARITVEDCLDNVENRFELVMLATKRARQLSRSSSDALVPIENDKPTVVALREIAEGLITKEILERNLRRDTEAEHAHKDNTHKSVSEAAHHFRSDSRPPESHISKNPLSATILESASKFSGSDNFIKNPNAGTTTHAAPQSSHEALSQASASPLSKENPFAKPHEEQRKSFVTEAKPRMNPFAQILSEQAANYIKSSSEKNPADSNNPDTASKTDDPDSE